MAAVCLGSSTVPAAVAIVVKHRARLSVSQIVDYRRIGMISIIITGVLAIVIIVIWQYGASII